MVSVYALRSGLSQLRATEDVEEMFEESHGRSIFWPSLNFFIICSKDRAWCG